MIFEKNELIEFLSHAERLVLIGVGNENLGDDGVGVYIVNSIHKATKSNFVLNGGSVPENITHKLRNLLPTHILLIDAANFNEEPGSFILATSDDVVGKSISTHQLPLSILMKYLENEYHANVRLLCIQIESKIPSMKLTQSVLHTANNLINILIPYFSK